MTFLNLKTKRNNRRKEARDKVYTEREQEKERDKTREKIRVREGAFEKGRKERKGKLISSALC